jgi:hypothetical protein
MQLNTFIPKRYEFVVVGGSTFQGGFMLQVCCAWVCIKVVSARGIMEILISLQCSNSAAM